MTTKQNYRVIWEVDVEAETPHEAAMMAADMMDTPWDDYFIVKDAAGNETRIDLDPADCDNSVAGHG